MDDLSGEIEDIRRDIKTLRTMIDAALNNGAGGDDLLLRASANVLYDRRARLDQIERAAGFEAEGRDKQSPSEAASQRCPNASTTSRLESTVAQSSSRGPNARRS